MSLSPAPEASPVVVLLRADATARIGVGHAMRLLALAQELLARGQRVHLAGSLEIGWVAQSYTEAGVIVHPAPRNADALATLAERLGARVCVLDRYDLDADYAATLRARGLGVMVMVDGSFSAHQEADLYVDQNPGSTPRATKDGQVALAGARYTLFRDDVLALRRHRAHSEASGGGASSAEHSAGAAPSSAQGAPTASTHIGTETAPMRVLAVFGGTDPCGAAPVVTPLLVDAATRCGVPLDLTVVTPDASWAEPLVAALPTGATLTTTGALTDLASRASKCDLVITASGSSVWELLCLGVPIGVVCVIDNQRPGYEMVLAQNLALGVGHLDALRDDAHERAAAINRITATLADPAQRAQRAARGRELLDGEGRRRVADAVLTLAASASSTPHPPPERSS